MSNLTTLLKVNLRESLDKRKFKANKKQQAFLVYIIIMAILFIGLSTFYSIIYASSFKLEGMVDKIYTLSLTFFAAATFMTFTSSLSKMQTIFVSSDYDILSALPIKKRDIVLSKVFNLYVIELLISLVLLLPNSIVNCCFSGNFIYLLLIPLAFVAPAFPMLIALLLVALIELLIKSQKIKTIISALGTISIFIVIFAFAFMSGFSSGGNGTTTALSTIGSVSKYINPSLFFLEYAFTDNYLWFIPYVASNLVLLIVVLGIVIKAFNKIHNNMMITKLNSQNKKYKAKHLVYRSQAKQIRHMTIKNFFRNKNAIMQSSIGLIMTIVMTIAIVIAVMAGVFTRTNDQGKTVNILDDLKPYVFVLIVFFTFFVSIMPPSATAISSEGMNFNILKSVPLDFKAYLREKLFFSFIVLLVPTMISAILIAVFIPQTIFSIIMTLVLPIVFCFFISAYTLIINSAFPYLNWKEEIEIYKYHKSTIITVFTDMGISIGSIILVVFLAFINPYLAGLVIVGIYLVLSIVLYIILMKVSSKKLANLEISD